MTYGKKYIIRWTPQLKRAIVLTLVVFFALGTIFGFIIGFSVKAEAKSQNIQTSSTASTASKTQAHVTSKPINDVISVEASVLDFPSTKQDEPTTMYYDVPLDRDLQDYIFKLCDKNNISVALVLGIIETESSFIANVISGSNDYGLMQINKINHEWLSEEYGITDFLDPYQNVFCGITILTGHYEQFQNVDKALMAYNLGETGAKRMWNKGVYTTSYVEKVKEAMAKYE